MTNTDTITIGLIEDQLLFREGMKNILNHSSGNRFKVVFESGDGYSVIGKLTNSKEVPNVMLVDLSLPPTPDKKEFSGLDVTQALINNYPDIKILILSVHDDDNFIADLIEHGAHGYLVKDSDPQEVFTAIESVFHKGTYINEQTLKAIQTRMGKKAVKKKINIEITKREEEILQLVCQQYTAEEIAQKLYISVKTVNGHRNNLLLKTHSKNVTGLVLYAVKNHIVEVF
jgi:DNA-binding NarL/FixJ family response regulator